MRTLVIAALALAASPAFARTIEVAAGPDAQARLQEALIAAQPGDTVAIGPGRFQLTDGLSLDANNVVVRGAGMSATVLDFAGQQGAGEGLLVTGDDVTLRDFAVVDAHGDGIKSKGADRVVYYRVRAAWTGGPKETNGAYGIYPVESTGVLIDSCQVEGASDAGIYVGQSKDITVRYSLAEGNVAGIEIENSRNALVTYNMVTRNTGGILVFDLPSLPVMGGGNTVLMGNLVVGNDTPNFAPKGNIVAAVRRGTGVMVMANDGVRVTHNIIRDNPTSGVMVVSYPRAFTDARYNPTPRNVTIDANTFAGNGDDPQLPGAEALKAAFGGTLPPVIWDGIGPAGTLMVDASAAGLSLNLAKQGDGAETARHAPLPATAPVVRVDEKTVGAPGSLEARLSR
jgi:parallel beta-helix repeat protein